MIKIIFNFKYIHMYVCFTYFFFLFNNLKNYLYLYDKNVFNFKYIHALV